MTIQSQHSDLLFTRVGGTDGFTHDTNGEYFLALGLVANHVDLVAFSEEHPELNHRSLIQFAAASSGLDAYLEGMVKRYYGRVVNNPENSDAGKLIEIAAECLIVEGSKEDIQRHQAIGNILLDNFFLQSSNFDEMEYRMNLFSKIAYGNQECIDRLKKNVYPTQLQWYPMDKSVEALSLKSLVQIAGDDKDLFSYFRDHIDTRKSESGNPLRNSLSALKYSKSEKTTTLLKEILHGDYGDLLLYTEHFFYISTGFTDAFETLCHVNFEEAQVIAKQCLTTGFAGKDRDYYNNPSFYGYNLLTYVSSLDNKIKKYERPSPHFSMGFGG